MFAALLNALIKLRFERKKTWAKSHRLMSHFMITFRNNVGGVKLGLGLGFMQTSQVLPH